MKKPFVSIILPVYNQALYIRSIIEQYTESLGKVPIDYEFLLIVNGCTDNSLSICNELTKTFPSVRTFEIKKSGWGSAVKYGLKEARGEFICYTNSARTKAKDLILFVLYSIANPDVIIKANRKIRDSWVRRVGSLIYNIECRTLYDLSNWDVNGTPKVFPRKYEKLVNLTRDDDLIDLEFNYICRVNEYPMLEIPIFFPKRQGGKSTTGFQSAFEMYLGAWKIRKLLRRIYNNPYVS